MPNTARRSLILTIGLLALAGFGIAETGTQQEFREGEHYARLPVPIETRDPSRVEVVEVFSYACIHCRNFQPAVAEWHRNAPESVDFYRMPATFNRAWAVLAQAYYTAEALDVTDQVHEPMFRAIHDRQENLADPDALAELFEAEAGIAPEEFHRVFNSFSVRSRVDLADGRGRAYRLSGTPTIIVDGLYRVDGGMAGSNNGILEVVDYLVAERQTAAAE